MHHCHGKIGVFHKIHMINSDLSHLLPQAGIHEQWGGVVPRLAQEGHKKARSFHGDAESPAQAHEQFSWNIYMKSY